MIENILLGQQKQDEHIKQLASKVNMLTIHNKMFEVQTAQQASSSSTRLGRLPSKPESNRHEHCNCVTLKKGEEDPRDLEDIPVEKGREIIMVESKER